MTTSNLAHKGPEGEFELLRSVPGGKVVLLTLAVGLFAYGTYKLIGAIFDTDGNGRDLGGAAARGGLAIGGAAYWAMCWSAVRFASDFGAASRDGGSDKASAILELPMGAVALGLAGVGFLAGAAIQLRSAITKHFMRKLDPDAPPFSCTIGRIGIAARAIVFTLIGWSLIRGAWSHDENQVRDLGGALAALRDNGALYLTLAVGLVVFAIYSALEARYRIVPRVDPIKATKRKIADV
jgi:hypothetical protein